MDNIPVRVRLPLFCTELCAKQGKANTHRNTVHTQVDRTETSQRVRRALLCKIIRRAEKELATESTEEHQERERTKTRAGALAHDCKGYGMAFLTVSDR